MTNTTGRPLPTYRAISLLLCLLLCTATVGHCAAESSVPAVPRQLVAAIPDDLPPTYFLDKRGKPAGFAVDVMNALGRRTGLTVAYVSGKSFDDVIQMVLTGKADLIPSLTIDEQRRELLAFTHTVGFLPANLFVASGNLTVQGISPGLTIGVMKGSVPENVLMKNLTIRLVTFTNLHTMLFELLAGHVDGIVFLTPNLMKLAIDAGVEDKIKVVGKPVIEAKRGIALRKGDTELLTRLNRAIEEFIGSPEYRRIYVKWYGKPKPYWTASRIGVVSGMLLVFIVCGMVFWRYRSLVRLNNRLTLSIAEHKQAEDALRESETKLQAVFDTVGTGIIIVDSDSQIIIEANQTAIEMTGLSQKRIIGQICHSVVCPAQVGKCPVKNLDQRVDHAEHKLRYADGQLKDILKTVYPITIKGRNCYLESFIDISERKRAEEALRSSEEEARSLAKENEVIAEIGRIISSSLNIDEVYERFAEEVRKLISIDRITVNIINSTDNTATTTYVSGSKLSHRNKGFIYPLAFTFTEEVRRTRKSLLINEGNYQSYLERFPGLVSNFQAGFQSLMVVPLLSKDEVIGALQFIHAKLNAYSEGDLKLAERMGLQIAGAIANAQLFRERKQAEEALKESEKKYCDLYENAPDMYYSVDSATRVISECNETFLRTTGYSKAEVIGRPIFEFFDAGSRDDAKKSFKLFQAVGELRDAERRVVCKDGRIIQVSLNVSAIKNKAGNITHSRAIWRDITARKEQEEMIRALSITDQLTGLYNRRGFMTLAEQQLRVAARTINGPLLFYADLDGLKEINDQFGHRSGDEAIIEAAHVLQEVFRKMDIIARMGGDEFAVLVPESSLGYAEMINHRLQNQLDSHNALAGRDYHLSLSIGMIYHDPSTSSSLDELISRADTLMYEQKRRNKPLVSQKGSET